MSRQEKNRFLFLVFLVLFFIIITSSVLANENKFFNDSKDKTSLDSNSGELAKSKESFPLIVFAGEAEGVSAAVTAARKGIETLLILYREKPGGLMTYGGLNFLDINNAPDGKNLNKGFFAEWHQKVGGKISFSIDRAAEVFEDMLANEKNLTVYRNIELLSINKRNNTTIRSIVIGINDEIKEISGEYFIDASQDADFAVKAGAPYFEGGADIGLPDRHMAVTLVLHLGNIDWGKLAVDVRNNRFGPSYINKDNAWGFVNIGQIYKPVNVNTKMRGLNIVIEEKGEKSEVYIKRLIIVERKRLFM